MATTKSSQISQDETLQKNILQDDVNSILWKACDTFRGTVDPSEYKNYILVMLFLKYVSDVWLDHYEAYKGQYGDDEERIRRRMDRIFLRRVGGGYIFVHRLLMEHFAAMYPKDNAAE
jgi:type I restriction-modification system DNA methylase subunit